MRRGSAGMATTEHREGVVDVPCVSQGGPPGAAALRSPLQERPMSIPGSITRMATAPGREPHQQFGR